MASAPPEILAVAGDPDNAMAEYYCVAHSEAAELLRNHGDVFNDAAWVPTGAVRAQLERLGPQVARTFAATRRARWDYGPGTGAGGTRFGTEDLTVPRTLLCAETRRRVAIGDVDGAAECVAGLLRRARQARSRDGLYPAIVSASTISMGCVETDRFVAQLRPGSVAVAELVREAEADLTLPLVSGAEDMDRQAYERAGGKLRALLDQLRSLR